MSRDPDFEHAQAEYAKTGRTGGSQPVPFILDVIDLDILRLALRGDVDMRRYLPEVMSLCARLGIKEPPWFEDGAVRERLELNRPHMPVHLPRRDAIDD